MKTLMLAALVWISAAAFAAAAPQTTCPVMKGPVDGSSKYVDVEGYRIYVCCGGCIAAIRADPARYIAQLKAEGVDIAKTPNPAPVK